MKIAIVYDWMDKWGGVERMLLTLGKMYPDADWYTSYIDYNKADWTKKLRVTNYELSIKPSFIQKLPNFIKSSRILSLPFYPYAFESFNFNKYDLVISVTSSFAKSIITLPSTKHICILLTPTRWLYTDQSNLQFSIFNFQLLKPLGLLGIKMLKKWDLVASQRPDKIVSISQTVADRCLKYYNRSSEVVYPPFDEEYWRKVKFKIENLKLKINLKFKIENLKFFLVVSRLEPYKKVDLVIETFNKMPHKNLVIVGSGTQKAYLNNFANKNIKFFEDISDEELGFLYSKAEALIMPQEEDFGYVSIEAQYFGCPVLSYGKGGATETVVSGKTGVFFNKQTVESLSNAIAEFAPGKYNLKGSSDYLKKFSAQKFLEKIQKVVGS